MNAPCHEQASPKILLHLTGFGVFCGVSDNPSSRLVREHLPPLLAASCPALALGTAEVLEVSAAAVGAYCSTQPPCPPGIEHIVYLHCGVAAGAHGFSLEAAAYNEASFRVPDERGAQPMQERIFADLPLGACLKTTLDLADLQRRLAPAWGHCMELSADPGRFLCNYVYASSLRAAAAAGCAPQRHCLFVHVPLEGAIPLPRQAAFLCDLASAIAAALGEGRVAADAASAPVSSVSAELSAAKNGVVAAAAAAAPAAAPAVLRSLLDLGFEEAPCLAAIAALGAHTDIDTLCAYLCGEHPATDAAPAPLAAGGPAAATFDLSFLGGSSASSASSSSASAKQKMVCIVRSDLGMSTGKIGSQVAHAVLGAYRATLMLPAARQRGLRAWERTGEKIVLLRGESGEGGLRQAVGAARAAGIGHALCRDAGRTEVEPGTLTVAAIGPAEEGEVDAITGALRLL